MPIAKVGVVGCGLMGAGIAQTAAQSGFPVVVREVTPELVEKGLKGIAKNLDRLVEKGVMTAADRDAARGRLRGGLRDSRAHQAATHHSDFRDRHS